MRSRKKRGVGLPLESLTDLALNVVFTKLDAKDLSRLACASRRLRELVSEEHLWSKFCLDDLDMTVPASPHGSPCCSFKVAYQLWREAFPMYPWCLVKRVKRCWDRIKTWLTNNFPEAAASLCRGADEADIQELENTLKVKLPLPTRILYRLHNGQTGADRMNMVGLMGGHRLIYHTVNVSLLPLKEIIALTQDLMRDKFFSSTVSKYAVSKYVVLAANSAGNRNRKVFLLNCDDGQLYVWSDMHCDRKELFPCVPKALINLVHDLNTKKRKRAKKKNSVHESNGERQQDAMLLWLEEHGRRLQSGIIKLCEERNVKSIDAFPEIPARYSTSVTNGVQVHACAMFIPELSTCWSNKRNYQFLSLVRLSLLPQGCLSNGLSFNSCQPYRRHWIIRDYDDLVYDGSIEVQLPIMDSSNREIVYEHLRAKCVPSGSMEGFFTCVPGRLTDPKGTPFEVIVPRHPMEVPDYVF